MLSVAISEMLPICTAFRGLSASSTLIEDKCCACTSLAWNEQPQLENVHSFSGTIAGEKGKGGKIVLFVRLRRAFEPCGQVAQQVAVQGRNVTPAVLDAAAITEAEGEVWLGKGACLHVRRSTAFLSRTFHRECVGTRECKKHSQV